MVWETERKRHRMDLISKNKYRTNTTTQPTSPSIAKVESTVKIDQERRDNELLTVNEINAAASNTPTSNLRSHHSQHHPLPTTVPTIIKGKALEPPPSQQQPIDALNTSSEPSTADKRKNMPVTSEGPTQKQMSRLFRPFCRLKKTIQARIKSYYMYYSLNNLFDWIIYILCSLTAITHFIDISAHTVLRARIHMYIASVTVICIWFRFMVFFRTISISAKTLRSKLVEIKLGELVIMVRTRSNMNLHRDCDGS
jgi:hypothetical protein